MWLSVEGSRRHLYMKEDDKHLSHNHQHIQGNDQTKLNS